jgi:CHASE3 domain sensor protein
LLGILAVFQTVAAIAVVVLLMGHSLRVDARKQAIGGLVTVSSFDDGYHWAEAGLRGYVLTGDARYLKAYAEGLERGERALADLRTRARERPGLRAEVEMLTRDVEQKRTWMSEILAHGEGSTLVVEKFREAKGLSFMEDISGRLAGIEASERAEIQALDRAASWHLGLGLGILCATTLATVLFLVADIQDRRRNEAMLRRSRQILLDLSEGTAGAVGPAFFASLAVHAASALGTRWAAVLQFEAPGRIGVLALAEGGEVRKMESFDAKDCFCLNEAAERVCFVPDGAERTHATHPLVAYLGARSFLGVPMVDDSHFKGALLVLDDKPMKETDLAVPALRAFAERTAAELERLRTEAALYQAQKLEALGALAGGGRP